MNLIHIVSTSRRVFQQLKHDPRTLLLLFIVPSLLITILKFVFNDSEDVYSRIAPMLLGIFPMVMMFLITSIATLRERRNGTLDRLMTMPISKIDFILGYAIAFSLVALLQAIVTSIVMLGILQVTVLGGTIPVIIGAVTSALLGTAIGLLLSGFAKSEFQAVQFMPAFIFPQLLICGLLTPRAAMAEPLQSIANIMPLTYSVDFMILVTRSANWTSDHTRDLLVVIAFTVAALILGSITIRRQEKP